MPLDKKMTSLFISYDGMTDPLGQSQVLPYLSELSKKGIKFHLISFEKEEKYEKFKSTIQKICDDAGIVWHPLNYTKKPPVFSTIYDVWRMNRLTKKLIAEHHIEVLHCRSYISALVGLGCKKTMGTKFIFDMRGFWADERVEGGLWNLKNPLFKVVYNFFKRKEIAYFEQADHTISLTHKGKSIIHSWKMIATNPIPIEVIPCCVNIEKFQQKIVETPAFETLKNQLNGSYVLGYVGSIGTWYMLDEMLDFFKVLKEQQPNAKFLFLSQEKSEILNGLQRKQIANEDVMITSCLHHEVPMYLSLFDASIFFIIPTFSKSASSPTKQGELMSMGIPIVCNAGVGDTDYVINQYHAGELVADFNRESYQKAIAQLLSKTFDRDEIKRGAFEFYSLKNGAERYYSVYEKILPNLKNLS